MPNNGGNITYGINFNVDKTGLNDLKKSLQDIRKMTTDDLIGNLNSSQAEQVLKQAKDSASQVEQALKKAFNPTLNTTNITKFNQELQKSGTNLNKVYQDFSKIGINGQTAFTNLAANILTTNVRLKQTHSLLDSMGKTMLNTVKWGIASSVMNSFTGSIQNAYNYVKALDSSLTDIRIVTGDSRAEMDQFAKSANTAAQALGRQTKEYTNAALAFYQQGLSDDQVAARAETTLKASNITGADVSSMADQLTAVWNGFQVQGEKTNEVVSKLAAIADSSASNMSELATAMSKSASIANNMGVDIDQLGAQISTIIATTRQAPQTVGNALKTIYARINDIKAGTDDAEISLGNYTSKMAQLGINVLDQNNQLRDTGQVMQEIGGRWGTMTRQQQVYLAQTMAGQRQMNNLIALFDHWDTYTKQLNISLQAQGTLDEKNARYMESLAAHTKQLQAAQEGLIQSFADSDSFKGFIDIGTNVINLFTKFIDTIGGGGTAVLGLGSIFTSVFSGVISRQINNFVTNIQNAKSNQQQLKQVIEQTQNMAQMEGIKGTAVETMINRQKDIQQYYSIMSEGQINHYNNLVKELGLATQQANNWKARQDNAKAFAQRIRESDEQLKILINSIENGEKVTGPLKKKISDIGNALEEAKDAFYDIGKSDQAVAKLKEKLDALMKASHATKEQVDALNEAFAKTKGMSEDSPQVENFYAKADEIINKTNSDLQDLNTTQSKSGQEIEKLRGKIKYLQSQLNELRNKNKQAFDIQGIIGMVGAMGQLATVWQSMASLPSIWHDDNLSGGQKFLRTVMSLSMALPMLSSAVDKISKGMDALSSITNAVTTATQTATGATEAATAASEAQAAADTANVGTTSALATSEGVVTVATGGAAEAAVKQGEAQLADAAAKTHNIKANAGLIASSAATKLAVLGVAAAIAILVVAYNDYLTRLKKIRQAQIQASNKKVDQINAKQDEIKANRQLSKAYLEVYQQYKLGNATKQQMERVTDSLIGVYDRQQIAVAKLTGNYDLLTQSIKNARREELEKLQSSAKDKIEAIDEKTGAVLEQASSQSVFDNSKGQGFYDRETGSGKFSISARSGLLGTSKIDKQALQLIADQISDAALAGDIEDVSGIGIYLEEVTGQNLAKLYDEITALIAKTKDNTELYQSRPIQQLEQLSKDIEATVGQYRAASADLQEYNAQLKALNLNFDKDDNLKDFSKHRQELVDWLKQNASIAADGTERTAQQIENMADAYIEQAAGQAAALMSQQVAVIDSIVKNFDKDVQDKVRDQLQGYELSDLRLIATVQLEPGETWQQALERAKQQAQEAAKISLASFSNQVSDILINNGGKGLTEGEIKTISQLLETTQTINEEQREKLQILTDQNAPLRQQFEILKEIRELQQGAVEDQILGATDDYIKSVRAEIEELAEKKAQLEKQASLPGVGNSTQIAGEIDAIQTRIDQLNQSLSSENIASEVKKITDSLNLESLSYQLQDAKEQAFLLAQGATLIGENYTVAAEDVDALTSIFPEILKGAEPLEDGSFKIAENIVKKFLESDAEEVRSQRETILQKLNLRRTQLEAITQMTDAEKRQYREILSYIAQINAESDDALTRSGYAMEGLGGDYAPKSAEEDEFDFEGLMAKIQDLKDLTDEEQTAWVEGLDELVEKYPELRQQIELLKNTQLASSSIYQDSLRQIQELLDSLKLDQAIQKAEQAGQAFEEAFANISTEGIDQFFDALNEYTQAEYSIDIQVQTQAEKAFDDIQQTFKRISDAASSIGENWTIPADKIREINSIFPGVLQGMQQLADGSYQLNQQIAQNAINAATTQAAAEADSIRSRLQDQSTLLHAKAQTYSKMAQAAHVLAQSEVTSEQEASAARGVISKGLADLKQINSQLATNKENKDQEAVANSSQANGRVVASNWAEAANSSAQAIYQFASNACQNMKAVAEAPNGGSPQPPPQIGLKYGGQAGVSVEASGLEAAQSAIDNPNTGPDAFKAMENQFKAMAEASEDAANQIDGMIAQIGANANKIADGINNLNEGRAFGDNGKSGKGGGGGGGGGKDKTKSAEEIDKLKLKDQDVDKYHQIERAIKRIDDYLDQMSDYEEKTIRQGKSDTIDKEVAALQQQKALYQQKIQMMQADLQLQQADLALLGVQFDEQGNIINYTALMSAYQAQYNALLEQAKLLTGDAQENKLQQASNLKQQLESLKSQMSAYEALQDKIVDAGAAIRDIIDKEEQLRIKQFKIKIDTQLEFADAKRDWNEFKKEVIDKIKDDDFLGQAKARVQDFFSYYDDQGNGIIQQLTEHVNRTRQEAEIIENGGTSSIYGKNQAQALEDLKKYTDDLMQNLKDVQEIAKDIHDLYLDTIDKAQDAFDEQIDQYEQVDKLIEHDMNLLQLLSPENNEEQLAHYYDQRAKNHNQEIDFYRKEADMWKAQMENAEQGTEEWKKFRDNWESSINDLNSAVESAVENLLDKYNNAISKIIKDTKNQIMGGDWQKAMDEWDRAKWQDDRYLDMGSRATGVLDFVDKVNEAMNNQSPKVQKQLNDFLKKEVDYLNQIPNLRQIDLDIAYKKLEVLQKQMALQDAQNAKTRMRLRRDSQGNYTYQYVADENDIANKQQQLRDTLEELRQLAKVDISDTMDEVQDKLTEFFEKAQELSQTYYNDQELLQQKLLELQNAYFGEQGYITLLGMDYHTMQEQLLTATGAQFSQLLRQQGDELKQFLGLTQTDTNATQAKIWESILALMNPDGGQIPTLFDAFVKDVFQKNLALMSEEHQKLLFGSETGLNPSWNTAIGNMAQNYVVLTRDVVLPCMQAMVNANGVYMQDLANLQQVAGVVFSDIASGLDTDIAYTQGLIQANDYLVDSFNNQINAIAGVNAQIANLCAQYAAAEQAAINAANAAIKFWFAAQGQSIGDYYTAAGSGGAAAPASTPVSSAPAASSGGSGGGSSTGGSSSNRGTLKTQSPYGERTYVKSSGSLTYTQAQNMSSFQRSTATGTTKILDPINRKAARQNMFHFSTGGYTGEWVNGDTEGRLAFLHQKELVLNPEDTVNMLNAVKIASGMMEHVFGVNGSLLDRLNANGSIGNIANANSTDASMSQNIVINADFPNANNAEEIRQAFNNLINIASQRASGNRRTY